MPQELDVWQTHPSQDHMPGGESLLEVEGRLFPALQGWMAVWPEANLLTCSHDTVLRLIIMRALGIELDGFWGLHIDNAAINAISHRPTENRVLAFNDARHLGSYRSVLERQAL